MSNRTPRMNSIGESAAVPRGPTSGRAVHILDQDARLHLDDGLLSIERPGEKLLQLRLPEIDSVSIHGRAGLTTPCLHALLAEGIPVIWRAASGYYLGQTVAPHGSSARRAQYAAQQTMLGYGIARRLVAGKLANMRALLRPRVTDPKVAAADRAIAALVRRAAGAQGIDTLLGLEGTATASYFSCWPALLKRACGSTRLSRPHPPPAARPGERRALLCVRGAERRVRGRGDRSRARSDGGISPCGSCRAAGACARPARTVSSRRRRCNGAVRHEHCRDHHVRLSGHGRRRAPCRRRAATPSACAGAASR